jgi:hypothetical protein
MALAQPTSICLEVYHRNISALARQQPAECAQIEAVELTDGITHTEGRDATPTFRLLDGAGRPYWLGHSSMPATSGPAVLTEFNFGSGNVVLPSMGHGYEARHLLDRMGPHQAVFTWDDDPLAPALALRLHDFSAAILMGRLVVALGPAADEALSRALEAYPAHLPPTKIFGAPHLDSEILKTVQVSAAAIAARQHQSLARNTARLAAEISAQPACQPSTSRRVMILSSVVDPEVAQIAQALAGAAEEADLQCATHLADEPARAHILSAAQQIRDSKPQSVILLNQARREWGHMLDGVRTCSTWCVSPSANRSELAHHRMPEDRIYATTPSLANGLAAADPNHADVRILGPAVDRRLFFPSALDEEDHVKYGSDVAVVMSAVDFTPEAIGLKWDSHQHLLSEIVRILRENPQRLHKDAADRVIELASRRTQVALDSGEVREQLAQFISAGLAPTLTALKLIRKLAADEVRVKLWGCNWDLHSATAALPSGPPPSHEERNKIYNAARVIVHVRNDRWHRQHLLDALAAGATVVGHDEQYSDETNDSSWQDLWTAVPRFGTISEAAATIRRWLNEPAAGASAVEPARRIALHNHSIEKRLQTLLGNETG